MTVSDIDSLNYAGVDFSQISELEAAKEAAVSALKSCDRVPDDDTAFQGIKTASSVGAILNLCFEAAVETTLQDPTFVMDFPVEVSPLAKNHRSKPGLVERFELYIAGETSRFSKPHIRHSNNV